MNQEKLDKLEDSAMYADSTEEISDTKLQLIKHTTELFKELHVTTDPMLQIDIKGHLNLVTALISICDKRFELVSKEAAHHDYKFRMAAKSILSRRTYQAIQQLAGKDMEQIKQAGRDRDKNDNRITE